jgi:hypothetical protein
MTSTEDLQNKFDSLVSKYMTLKKQVFDDIMKDSGQRDKYVKYFGKNVYYDGAYWYINKYGRAHKYSNDAWTNKSKSCPQEISSSLDLDDFLIGDDMKNNQRCGVVGNNVMNESSGEISWVDIDGNKHVYSSDAYKNRPSICNKEPLILSSIEYNAIPDGPPMTKTDYCFTSNINADDYEQLLNLNDEILGVSKQLLAQSNILKNTNKTQQKNVERQRHELSQKMEVLEKEKKQINERIDKINTIELEESDSKKREKLYDTTILTYSLSILLLGYAAYRLM